MKDYQSPTISFGTDVAFSLRLRLKGSTVTVYADGDTVTRAMSPEDIDLAQVQDLSVALRPYMSHQEIVPPFRVDLERQRVVVEFPATRQRLGDWSAVIRFALPSSEYADQRAQYTTTVPLCYVEDSSQIISQQSIYYIDAYAWAVAKGEPGDPRELLPQVREMVRDEVAAQSPDLVSVEVGNLVPSRVTCAVSESLPNALKEQLPAALAPQIPGAVEAALAEDLASKAVRKMRAGLKNIIENGRQKRIIPVSLEDGYNAAKYGCYAPKPNNRVGYVASAMIEVLEGDIDYVAAYIYGIYAPQKAFYDKIKAGAQRLTWFFDAEPLQPYAEGTGLFCIYAGVNGGTKGRSLAAWDVTVFEGNVPIASWVAPPEEVRSEYLVRYKSQCELYDAILNASYGKIRPYKRLTPDMQALLTNLHVNYNGERDKLLKAIASAFKQPADESLLAVLAAEATYKDTYCALRGALDDAPIGAIDAAIAAIEDQLSVLSAK